MSIMALSHHKRLAERPQQESSRWFRKPPEAGEADKKTSAGGALLVALGLYLLSGTDDSDGTKVDKFLGRTGDDRKSTQTIPACFEDEPNSGVCDSVNPAGDPDDRDGGSSFNPTEIGEPDTPRSSGGEGSRMVIVGPNQDIVGFLGGCGLKDPDELRRVREQFAPRASVELPADADCY